MIQVFFVVHSILFYFFMFRFEMLKKNPNFFWSTCVWFCQHYLALSPMEELAHNIQQNQVSESQIQVLVL